MEHRALAIISTQQWREIAEALREDVETAKAHTPTRESREHAVHLTLHSSDKWAAHNEGPQEARARQAFSDLHTRSGGHREKQDVVSSARAAVL